MNTTNSALSPGAEWESSPYLTSPSPAAIALPLLAFAAIVLDVPCLFWHVSNRNPAASMLVAWVILQNVIVIVGAATWPSDAVDDWWHGQGYCDIAVKLDFASGSAIVGATLCIIRALAQALDCSRPVLPGVEISKAGRIRQAALLYGLCVGVPIYMVIAAFVVQSNRYYIYAVSGCVMAEWHSILTLFLCYVPILVVMMFSCYYSVLVILRLYRYKRDIASVLASTQSGLSTKRFARLAGLSLSLIVIYMPALVFIIASEQPSADAFFAFDWGVVHDPGRWNTIILVPTRGEARIDRWFRVSVGFVVFACFGFGKIKVRTYYSHLLDRLGVDRAAYNIGHNPTTGSEPDPFVAMGGHGSQTDALSPNKTLVLVKSRARHMISKLSLRSRGSSTVSDMLSSSTYSQPTPLIQAGGHWTSPPSAPTAVHLPTQHRRPTGILEEALYEQDSTKDRHLTERMIRVELVPTPNQPPPTYQQIVATEAPARSKLAGLADWLSENVRPMGVSGMDWMSGRATTGSTSAGARHGFNRIMDGQNELELAEFQRLKDRTYEDYVIGRLT